MRNQYALMRNELRKLEPSMRDGFIRAWSRVGSATQKDQIIAALQAGDIEGAVRALRLDRTFFGSLDRVMTNAFYAGGDTALVGLPRLIGPDGFKIEFGFDVRAPRAEAYARTSSSELVTRLTETARQGVREFITNRIATGATTNQIALDIVGRIGESGRRENGIVGLTGPQSKAVSRAMVELLGDTRQLKAYLRRTKRDKRFDSVITEAIKQNKRVGARQAHKIALRYSDRLLRLRGQNIARTELLTSFRAGKHEGFAQLVESGNVRDDQIVRTWKATEAVKGGRTRDQHVDEHDQSVTGLNTPFVMTDGSLLLYPGDTSLFAEGHQTVNCRCMEEIRVKRRSDAR